MQFTAVNPNQAILKHAWTLVATGGELAVSVFSVQCLVFSVQLVVFCVKCVFSVAK